MNLGIFIVGATTFLIAFAYFKISAFRKIKNKESTWLKLILVFLVDYFVMATGALMSGVLFVSIFNIAHG
ncbi:hypothetical protein N9S29_02515 [SAR86 cluster bacterium]|jgi:hypothetical protein|nr:hypothetical protein [SAR86 cluster bacterium]